MQAVLDFYVGFAWFMFFGSLTGLAVMALQPVFDRFRRVRPLEDDRHQPIHSPGDHTRLRPAA